MRAKLNPEYILPVFVSSSKEISEDTIKSNCTGNETESAILAKVSQPKDDDMSRFDSDWYFNKATFYIFMWKYFIKKQKLEIYLNLK